MAVKNLEEKKSIIITWKTYSFIIRSNEFKFDIPTCHIFAFERAFLDKIIRYFCRK